MLRVAVTGGIGAGKSTVSRLLAAHGAVVVDADALAREAIAPGSEGEAEVLGTFGPAVATPDGHVDRAALARLVFADPQARQTLEGIVHPRVEQARQRREAAAQPAVAFVYDVPLLAETGRDAQVDVVVVVAADEEVRLARLAARGMAVEDARARMAAQADDAERRRVADVVLRNDGDEAALAEQVERLWQRWQDEGRLDPQPRAGGRPGSFGGQAVGGTP